MFGFWSYCLAETAYVRGVRVLTKASTVKLPSTKLRHLSWGGGCSPKGAEGHSAIVFLRFPVLQKASTAVPEEGLSPQKALRDITGETGLF